MEITKKNLEVNRSIRTHFLIESKCDKWGTHAWFLKKKVRKDNQNFLETYKRTANPKLSNSMTKTFGTKIEVENVRSFQNENGLQTALSFPLVYL